MSKTEFDKFVERQQAKQKEEAALDPKEQLKQWLEYLDDLYKQISEFLKDYVAKGAAEIAYRDIDINEDFIGAYTARELLLKIGSSSIILRPIGTMLIGSKGRVDVQGPRGSVRIGLVNKQATSARQLVRVTVTQPGNPTPPSSSPEQIEKVEWVWKIINPAPDFRFIDLTQDTFFDMIMLIADA